MWHKWMRWSTGTCDQVWSKSVKSCPRYKSEKCWQKKKNKKKEEEEEEEEEEETRPVNRSEHSCMLRLHFVKFDLWPLNHKLDKEVTIDIFWCLSKVNIIHIDIATFVIWTCFEFDLSLTFDLLTEGRTKRSPWTILDVCPRTTYWHCYFCHLWFDLLWPLTFNHRSDKEVTE